MAKGGWLYIMAERYRGTMYVGVSARLDGRLFQHGSEEDSQSCRRYGLNRLVWAETVPDIVQAIEQEKRTKRWRRAWKFEPTEAGDPEWCDLSGNIV